MGGAMTEAGKTACAQVSPTRLFGASGSGLLELKDAS